jgi:hypothetical protein
MKVLTFISFLCLFTRLLAQSGDSDFILNEAVFKKSKGDKMLFQVIGQTEQLTYTITGDYDSNLWLESVDQKGNRANMTEVSNLRYNGVKRDFDRCILSNNHLYLFSRAHHKKNGQTYLIIDEYDPIDLKPLSLVKLDSVDFIESKDRKWLFYEITPQLPQLKALAWAGLYCSSNGEHVVDFIPTNVYAKGEKPRVSMRILDKDLNARWIRDYDVPFYNYSFKFTEVLVDSKGDPHILCKEYLSSNEEFVDRKINYVYHVFSFINGGNQFVHNRIVHPDLNILEMTIHDLEDGNLQVTGFLCGDNAELLTGTFILKLDVVNETTDLINKNLFADDLILKTMDNVELNHYSSQNKTPGLSNFVIRRVNVLPDGSTLISAEQQKFIETTTLTAGSVPNQGLPGTGSMSVPSYKPVVNDLVIARIDKNGKLIWNAAIPKSQSCLKYQTRNSYTWCYCDNKIRVVYNSGPGTTHNEVVMATIDENGKIEYSTVIEFVREVPTFQAEVSQSLKECEIFLNFAKGNSFGYGKLSFKK